MAQRGNNLRRLSLLGFVKKLVTSMTVNTMDKFQFLHYKF